MILPELFAQVTRSFCSFPSYKTYCKCLDSRFDRCTIRAHLFHQQRITMSRVCQVTGKRPMAGNNVSHAHNKTKRRFLPNLQSRRFWVESENRWVRMLVSKKGVRIIDKQGIETVLANIRARKKTA